MESGWSSSRNKEDYEKRKRINRKVGDFRKSEKARGQVSKFGTSQSKVPLTLRKKSLARETTIIRMIVS